MDNQELINKILIYEEKIENLEKELKETKDHLKKYTAPSSMKKYYENHKEEIKQAAKDLGFLYEIWIFDNDGKILNKYI